MAVNNFCHIEGYLGQDPDMKYTPDGKAITSINVGVSEYKGKEKDNETQWFTVKFFGPRAESINEYLKKGNLVTISGRMSQYRYQDKEGNTKYGFNIVGDDYKSYNKGGAGTGASTGASKPAAKKPAAVAEDFGDDGMFGDGDEF